MVLLCFTHQNHRPDMGEVSMHVQCKAKSQTWKSVSLLVTLMLLPQWSQKRSAGKGGMELNCKVLLNLPWSFHKLTHFRCCCTDWDDSALYSTSGHWVSSRPVNAIANLNYLALCILASTNCRMLGFSLTTKTCTKRSCWREAAI